MDAKVTWKQRLSFDGTATSGFTLPLGSRPEVGGDNDGFRPMELIIDRSGRLYRHGCDFHSDEEETGNPILRCECTCRPPEEHPQVFTRATIEYQCARQECRSGFCGACGGTLRNQVLQRPGHARQGISHRPQDHDRGSN